jgi:hypothetical protein
MHLKKFSEMKRNGGASFVLANPIFSISVAIALSVLAVMIAQELCKR